MRKSEFKMTERDSQVLLSIYKHRFLAISQIQKLHFPSMQTAYRRVRILKDQELLSDFTIPNINGMLLTVSRKGLNEIAALLGVELSELRHSDTKNKPKDYYFMRHFLAINDFRIQLSLECDASDMNLLGFIPDYYGERTKKGGTTKYIRDVVCDIKAEREEVSHTPDGVFALKRSDKAGLFFLEIDRGTETVSDPEKGVLKAIRFYANYLLRGKYLRYRQDFQVDEFKGFRALFVTTTDTRIENIRQAAVTLNVPAKAKAFVWLSTFEAITRNGLFAPVWVSSDIEDKRKYKIG